VEDDELARLATVVLHALRDGVGMLSQERPRDARRALSLWGLVMWRGATRERETDAVADWERVVALPDPQLRYLVGIVRIAGALLR
jgi:hypothetical protein